MNRTYIRHPSNIPIYYNLVELVSDRQDYLKNISIEGLCFRSKHSLEQGTKISVKIPLTSPVFEGVGVVIWCQPAGTCYEVGIRFIDECTGFRARMVEQICYIEEYKQRVYEQEGRTLSGEEAALEWIMKYAEGFPGIRK